MEVNENELNQEPSDETGTEDPGSADEDQDAAASAAADEIQEDETPTPDLAADDTEKKKGGVQKKINRLTREKAEAERRTAYLEGQLSVQQAKPEAVEVDIETAPGQEPQEEDFPGDFPAYLKAAIKYGVDKSVTAEKVKSEVNKKAEAQAKNNLTIAAQYKKAGERHEDFTEVALDPSLPVTQDIIDAAMGKNFAEILYYLGKNQSQTAQIAALSPLQVAREIGKIETKITAPSPKPKTKPSDAGEVIDAIESGSSPVVGADITKMTRKQRFAQWEKDKASEPPRDHY